VRKPTLVNLTRWPGDLVEGLRAILKGGVAVNEGDEGFEIIPSLPHGHVAAVLGMLRKLGLDALIASRRSRQRDLVVTMIAARIIDPRSNFAF